MKTNNKLLLVSLLTVGMLVGCGGGDTSSSSTTTPSQGGSSSQGTSTITSVETNTSSESHQEVSSEEVNSEVSSEDVSSEDVSSEESSSAPDSDQEIEGGETEGVEPIGKKLGIPNNVSYDTTTGFLSWGKVKYATSYRVTVNQYELPYTNTNTFDIWEQVVEGVRNTISVQAFDTTNKYQTSEPYSFYWYTQDENKTYEGFVVSSELGAEYTIKEEEGQKVVEIPYSNLGFDESGAITDITVHTDYDAKKENTSGDLEEALNMINVHTPCVLLSESVLNPGHASGTRMSFKGIGEVEFDIVAVGDKHSETPYVYDSLIVRVVKDPSPYTNFRIARLDDEMTPHFDDEFTISSTGGYLYLYAYDGENDLPSEPDKVTWAITSGNGVRISGEENTVDCYLFATGTTGQTIVTATSSYGDVDTYVIITE